MFIYKESKRFFPENTGRILSVFLENYFEKYVQYDFTGNNLDNLYDFFNRPDLVIYLAWEGLDNYLDLIHIEKNLGLLSRP